MKNKTDAETLREARLEAGLSIQGLADKAGLKWAAVQALEAGRYSGTFTAKVKLSAALGVPLKKLFPVAYMETADLMASFGAGLGKATKGKVRAKKAK